MITQKEIEDIINQVDEFRLVSRSNNEESGIIERNAEEGGYSYNYLSGAGIIVVINPITKSFNFTHTVGYTGFWLKSGKMSPLTYQNHFSKNYNNFKKIVDKLNN